LDILCSLTRTGKEPSTYFSGSKCSIARALVLDLITTSLKFSNSLSCYNSKTNTRCISITLEHVLCLHAQTH
jgi:hypothetical protein